MEQNQAIETINTKTGEIVETVKSQSFTPEQVQLLKRTVCKDATDDEFAVFLNVCKKVQLDPFAKQIYAVKYKGNLTAQTSIDGLRLIADRTGRYAPGKAPTYTYDKDGVLESATAYIMKSVGGQWFEVSSTAYFKEYVNSFNNLWQKLPHAMLAKCAEAHALRRAFPNETSGLYATEEMDQANTKPTVQMPKQKAEIPVPVENTEPEPQEEVIEFPGESVGPAVENPTSESKPSASKVISEKQQKFLFAKWRSAGFEADALKKHLQSAYGIEHTKDLTRDQLNEVVAMIDKEGKK